jgi:enamine deaminase RidA (YjgF/YER057c/UK114 family)
MNTIRRVRRPCTPPIILLMPFFCIGGCTSAPSHNASGAMDVVRQPLEVDDPAFPVAAAVMTKTGTDTVYVTGLLPTVVNQNAPKDSVEAYGNTETQTTTILNRIRVMLAKFGFGMGDIVKMTVYLVGDQSTKADYSGMLASYAKYFGTNEQPNKPARTAVQVVALRRPGALVEIEVIAARQHPQSKN